MVAELLTDFGNKMAEELREHGHAATDDANSDLKISKQFKR